MVKVFFCYSSKQNNQHDQPVKSLKDLLQDSHLQLDFYEHCLDYQSPDQDTPLDLVARIKKADIFISEMSHPSQTLGFLLAYAVNLNKPSLYLYPNDPLARPGSIITHNPSRLISVEKYTSANLGSVLTDFLDRATQKLISARTTFVSSKGINDYILHYSLKNNLSKGEVIRKMLETYIDANPL